MLSFQTRAASGHINYSMFVLCWNRWTYQEFFSRYRVLMKQKDVLPDKKMTCKNVLEQLVQVQQQEALFEHSQCLSVPLV